MILEVLFASSLIAPGFAVCRFLQKSSESTLDRIALSYFISLAIMLGVLFVGANLNAYGIASLLVLLIVSLSICYLLFVNIKVLVREPIRLMRQINTLNWYQILGILSVAGAVCIYSLVFHLRPILDSDVTQFYLPIAREIATNNGFTYQTGYDYNVLLKPIGVSVIYGWTYVIGGSTILELFRFMPIVPIIILIILMFLIAKETTNKVNVAVLSTIIFLVVPLHERFLLYNGFYPDIFYYPLAMIGLLYILRFSKTNDRNAILIVGSSIGLGSLLKAQAIFLLVATLLIILVIGMRRKRISLLFCGLLPFAILVPNFLAESIQRAGFIPTLSGFTSDTLLLFILLGVISGISFLYVNKHGLPSSVGKNGIGKTIRGAVLLLLPVFLFASFWYISNLVRFGSLLYTSSINLPNYSWAIDLLETISPTTVTVGVQYYIAYLVFMPLDPSVMGYVWIVPLITGFWLLLRAPTEHFSLLFLIEVFFGIIVFSQVVYYIPIIGIPTYNPRDIILFTPLLMIATAQGIIYATNIARDYGKTRNHLTLPAVVTVAYFGTMSYVHSVVVWFVGTVMPSSTLVRMITYIVSPFGLTIRETSFQISTLERVTFLMNHRAEVFLFSVIVGMPIILFLSVKYSSRLRMSLRKLQKGYSSRILWSSTTQATAQLHSTKSKGIVMALIVLSVIMVPRGSVFLQTDSTNIDERLLDISFGGLYDLIQDEENPIDGGILTYKAPPGLAYYLLDQSFVDLRWAANLAHLKDTLFATPTNRTIIELREAGIKYLLLNLNTIDELDILLNHTISKIISEPHLSIGRAWYGFWILYELGPFAVEKQSVPLSEWQIYPKYTNASYTFSSNESHLNLELYPSNNLSQVTIISYSAPIVDINEFTVTIVRLLGTSNARLLIRLFLENNTTLTLSYWENPSSINTSQISLKGNTGTMLSGTIYIGLMSSDEFPASIEILEICLVKIISA